jgi:hypothetical protein
MMRRPLKPALKNKRVHHLAVDTAKDEHGEGEKAVMIYDMDSGQIVGNNVYDLKPSPKVGNTSKFDTYTAEYVGTGS